VCAAVVAIQGGLWSVFVNGAGAQLGEVVMRVLVALLLFLCSATAASAHTGIGDVAGLQHGFLHPIGGLDHVLTMVAVGLFAYGLGDRALWLVPSSFVAMMVVGGVLGITAVPVPFVELAIALSVVVIGGAVAYGRSVPLALAMAMVGFFAVFHGFAHGAEMPETATGLAYAVGFVLATALLHVCGIALGAALRVVDRDIGARIARFGGATVSLAGVAILAGIF
jgi:urease accessory protein